MLRDYASFNNNNDDDDSFFYPGGIGSSSSSNVNNNYYDTNTNWRKNQGYNVVQPIPPELGGTIPHRDAETNPYYDPGWAQSVRRDSSTTTYGGGYGGYGGYAAGYYGGRGRTTTTTTYPGMTNPRKTEKIYTNPTNPYYDPVWSQSYVRKDVPIRDAEHTMYYAPGYDRNSNMYSNGGIGMGGGGNYWYGDWRMMMDEFDDGYYGGGGGGGGYYGRGGMVGPMYATPPPTTTTITTNTIARRSSGWKKNSDAALCNTNSLMR